MVIFYMLFAFIDKMVYSLISQILRLIIDLSIYNFFSQDSINNFLGKVYVILGVVMLFKLVISGIQYLVNPDLFDDKQKGLYGILKRIIISIVLIVAVRDIFPYAIRLQVIVIKEIPHLFFQSEQDDIKNIGDNLAISTFSGFIELKKDKKATVKFESTSDIYDVVMDSCQTSVLRDAFWDGSNCAYSYWFILSTAVGVLLCYILVSMAIEVGIRVIKLGIIQILAPIPLASYVTDEKKLSNFVKTSLTVYADLFINLGIVYFCIYFIKIILKDFATKTGYPPKMLEQFKEIGAIGAANDLNDMRIFLIKLFIIVCLLLFAKKAPKFISQLIGLPEGTGSIGDMFKRAGGLFGATTSVPGRFMATKRNEMNRLAQKYGNGKSYNEMTRRERREMLSKARSAGENPRTHALRNALRAAGSGLSHGVYESVAHNKGYSESRNAVRSASDRSYAISKAIDDKGITRKQYKHAVRDQRRGIESTFSASNREIEAAKAISDSAKASLDYSHNNTAKFSDVQFDERGFQEASKTIKKPIFIGYDNGGHAIRVNVSDMANAFERDAIGNIVFDPMTGRPKIKKGAYSVAGVIKGLQEVVSDTTGRYSAQERADAEGNLDKLQGVFDAFVANNASNASIVGKENQAYLNVIQDALDNFNKYARDTEFGREMIEEGILKGIINPDNNQPFPERIGDFLALIKTGGQRKQKEEKRAMGTKEMAAMSAEEIAKQFDNKK